MKSNRIMAIMTIAVILMGFTCKREKDQAVRDQKIEHLIAMDSDIYEMRETFIKNGFYVSSIADATGRGEHLSMTIELKEKSFVDSFGYATGIDLAPWKRGEKTHFRVTADLSGRIIEIEAR